MPYLRGGTGVVDSRWNQHPSLSANQKRSMIIAHIEWLEVGRRDSRRRR
jgi:hypothetical protein